MDLMFASPPVWSPTRNRIIFAKTSFSSRVNVGGLKGFKGTYHRLAAVAFQTAEAAEFVLEEKKHELLRAIMDTQRGADTNADQRSSIEESLVEVERYDAGAPIDLVKLDGTWRLQYTSAPDVLILLEAAKRFPFIQVGQIYQKFECKDKSDIGVIRNVVRWSFPTLLEEQEGATLLVSANFDVVSARNIYLRFEEISVQTIYINEQLQALIAPAILPRSFLSLQFQAVGRRIILPLLSGQQHAFGTGRRRRRNFCLYKGSASQVVKCDALLFVTEIKICTLSTECWWYRS